MIRKNSKTKQLCEWIPVVEIVSERETFVVDVLDVDGDGVFGFIVGGEEPSWNGGRSAKKKVASVERGIPQQRSSHGYCFSLSL